MIPSSFVGNQYIKMPLGAQKTLSAGDYWIALWGSTASTGGRAQAWNALPLGLSQATTVFLQLGQANASTEAFEKGNGVFTTGVVGWPSSIAINAISTSFSQAQVYFQLEI